jgi:hypothetical protein
MARSTEQERLQKLQERRDQLNAQLAAMEARAKQTQKKQDDRRKILLGALVLADLDTRPELRNYLAERLPGFLVRPEDRKLFAALLPAPPASESGGVAGAPLDVTPAPPGETV